MTFYFVAYRSIWHCRYICKYSLEKLLNVQINQVYVNVNKRPTFETVFLLILPDKHNNPNFGDVIPNNFPGIFDHLDLLFPGIHSSSILLLLCAPLSKLRFCAQT